MHIIVDHNIWEERTKIIENMEPYVKRKRNELIIKKFALVGQEMENTIQQIIDIADYLESEKAKIEKAKKNGAELPEEEYPIINMVITGAPGTGKTTVARLFSELLNSIGILSSTKFVKIDATPLHDLHIVGFGDNLKRAADEALGGVLIIDDADVLDCNCDKKNLALDFMQQIVEITNEHRKNLCVILCGYEDIIDSVVKRDPSGARCFPINLKLQSYGIETLMLIFEDQLVKEGKKLADGVREKVIHVIESNMKDRGFYFGNARYIKDELIPKIDLQYIARGARDGIYTLEDIKNAFPEVLK